jgi:hypothetical protein
LQTTHQRPSLKAAEVERARRGAVVLVFSPLPRCRGGFFPLLHFLASSPLAW